ncbi:MAG: hypothetical protein ABIM30_07320 [candidate division WOR-3 bacterium]
MFEKTEMYGVYLLKIDKNGENGGKETMERIGMMELFTSVRLVVAAM